MFSGIIECTGSLLKISKKHENFLFEIQSPKLFLDDVSPGDSISINGACLTVTKTNGDHFSVDVMPETIKKTNFKFIKNAEILNLEKSLRVGDRISGHFVTGHIDSCEDVLSFSKSKKGKILTISVNPKIRKFISEKGSITINGVSLTVVSTDNKSFSVALIPYTLEKTNLGKLKKSDKVNIEIDLIARYVLKMNKY